MTISNIIELYTSLTKYCPINTLGSPFSWYYADQGDSNILANNLIEMDVKSAFPNICRIKLGEAHPFVEAIYSPTQFCPRHPKPLN